MSDNEEPQLPTYEQCYGMVRQKISELLEPFVPTLVETQLKVMPFEYAMTMIMQLGKPNEEILLKGTSEQLLEVALSYAPSEYHNDISKTFELLVMEDEFETLRKYVTLLYHMSVEIENSE